MLPAGPLMKEHRTIETVINLMREQLRLMDTGKDPDPVFIDQVLDFMRIYADRCHHGKEEDILFRELKKKKLSVEHKKIMDGLIADHERARGMVKALTQANAEYGGIHPQKTGRIKEIIKGLIELYPRHIETEDKRFFLPAMGYFDKNELSAMLFEFGEFDKNLIHEKYKGLAKELKVKS